MEITHGSLFAGIGGFDLGFQRVGIKTLWDVEIEPYCQSVLKKNFPDTEIYSDVREVGKHNLKPIDILSGGFPCQDISVAGHQAGIKDGTRSGLWSEFHRIIGELRPRFVVIENVPNLVVLGLERVLCDLAEIGYDAEWQIISANDVGAHHLRKRIWIIAYPQGHSSCANTDSIGSHREKVNQQGKVELRDEQNCEPRSVGGDVADPQSRENVQRKRGVLAEKAKSGESSNTTAGFSRENVAHPEGDGFGSIEHQIPNRLQQPNRQNQPEVGGGEQPVSNSASVRRKNNEELATREFARPRQEKRPHIADVDWWTTEPDLGDLVDGLPAGLDEQFTTRDIPRDCPIPRVATGIPDRASRLKGLGNAIVPQIAELLGNRLKQIIEAENIMRIKN